MKVFPPVLLFIFVFGCGISYKKNLMKDVSFPQAYKSKKSISIDFKYLAGDEGDAEKDLKNAIKKEDRIKYNNKIENYFKEFAGTDNITFAGENKEKVKNGGYDISVDLKVYYLEAYYPLWYICKFFNEISLNIIPYYDPEIMELHAVTYDKSGKEIKKYLFKEEIVTWYQLLVGLAVMPFKKGPVILREKIVENMIKTLIIEMKKDEII